MKTKFSVAVLVLGLLLAACQDKNQVGKGLEHYKDTGKNAQAIGQMMKSPQANQSPVSGAIGQPSQHPASPSPQPSQTIEVDLIHDNPYFSVGGKPSNEIQVSAGTLIRVVSKDPDRPRQFAAENGAFASPNLNEGQTWEYRANIKGEFKLTDQNVPFVFGILRVI